MESSGKKSNRASPEVLNPLGKNDNPEEIFCNDCQTKATTATKLCRDEEMLAATGLLIKRAAQKTIKIWSAGCSSGEEAYSLAIAACEEYKKLKETPRFTVFGTDINRIKLAHALKGVYLKANAAKIRNRYKDTLLKYIDESTGDSFSIAPAIREHVQFRLFDLRNRPKKHLFDYITCNHVLQYYDGNMQAQLLENMLSVLKPQGIFFIEGGLERVLEKLGLTLLEGKRQLYQRTR